MRSLKLLLLVLLTAWSTVSLFAGPGANGVITANAGTTFEMGPTGEEGVLTHTVDGIAQVSLMGNCLVHFDVLAKVPGPNEPWKAYGTMYFVSANGQDILRMDVTGWVVGDPASPLFGNLHYDGVITSGEGKFAGARGKVEIDGAGVFTSPTTGKATWTMKGNVFTHPN